MSNRQSAISYQLSAISRQSEKTPDFFKHLFTVHCSLSTDKKGFTLVELMITMIIFVVAIAAASQIFTGLLTQFKQQSKIAETNIEGVVGLDILRKDIAHAGLGLPWNVRGIPDTDGNDIINFSDTVPGYTEATDITYNDAPNNPPRAFRSGDGAGPNVAGSDYLVIKSASAATNNAAGKNTRLYPAAPFVRNWALYTEDPENTDRVIVLSPGSTDANSRSLVVNGGSYHTQYDTVSSYAPADNYDVRLVYGISPANGANSLLAPFNRADYYISSANVPRCAAGTGVLVKATLNHVTGRLDEMPVLDCVADLQVIFVDNNSVPHNDLSTLTDTNVNGVIDADEIRLQLRAVEVYILAHEGQQDPNFTFNNFTGAGDSVIVGRTAVLGRDFDLTAIADYLNYRWKVYTIAVQTDNLR
jgi:prepilin-type N-terminal cleavage/methylation domain-containing protein